MEHEEFGGHWYEVYSDYNIWKWTMQECASSNFSKSDIITASPNDMVISREFNSRFRGKNKTSETIVSETSWWMFASDGTPYEWSGWFSLVRRHYQIIDTDYNNYAIAYGCDNLFGGLFHLRWASLLSRMDYLQYEYVKIAKDKMVSINYDYNFWWVKSGLRCGYDAAPTQDEIMVAVFDTEPDWYEFAPETSKTQRASMLFLENSNLPSGPITGPLAYDGTVNIQTNLAHQIYDSDYQDFFKISHVAYD
jgi:hypothetical protein